MPFYAIFTHFVTFFYYNPPRMAHFYARTVPVSLLAALVAVPAATSVARRRFGWVAVAQWQCGSGIVAAVLWLSHGDPYLTPHSLRPSSKVPPRRRGQHHRRGRQLLCHVGQRRDRRPAALRRGRRREPAYGAAAALRERARRRAPWQAGDSLPDGCRPRRRLPLRLAARRGVLAGDSSERWHTRDHRHRGHARARGAGGEPGVAGGAADQWLEGPGGWRWRRWGQE